MVRALTLENVLSLIPQEEVMQKYLGFEIYPMISHRVYFNPFRKDDSPRCKLRYTNNVLNFEDYASPYFGDAVAICSYRLNTNLVGALKHLNKEYNLGLGYDNNDEQSVHTPIPRTIIKPVEKVYSTITCIHYSDFSDNDYFFDFNIKRTTLNYYEVRPCQKAWVDSETFNYTPNNPLYSYSIDDKPYKIYRPLATKPIGKPKKWRSNAPKDFVQGAKQIKDYNSLVIRTSSLKDVMTLYELGLQADAPNCENIIVEPTTKMILLYNNDEPGLMNMEKHAAVYNCDTIVLPEMYHKSKLLKDPSDISKAFGLATLRSVLLNYNGKFREDLFRALGSHMV